MSENLDQLEKNNHVWNMGELDVIKNVQVKLVSKFSELREGLVQPQVVSSIVFLWFNDYSSIGYVSLI